MNVIEKIEADRSLINSPEEIGDILKKARKHEHNKLSLMSAAKLADISFGYLSDIENGSSCSMAVIEKLCNVYSILPEMVLFKGYPLEIIRPSRPTKKGSRRRDDLLKYREKNFLSAASG